MAACSSKEAFMRFIILALLLTLPLSAAAEEKSSTKKKAAPAVKEEVQYPPTPFVLSVKWLDEKNRLLPDHAFCTGAGTKEGPGRDISPEIAWTKGPEGTKSYALVMHDPDVPIDFSNAGKAGVEIEANAERQPFYHWLLVDISPKTTQIPMGAESEGKAIGRAPNGKLGLRGVNDYTKFMNQGKEKPDVYVGYGGPCPPFNDARPHRYIFTLYALDVPSLKLEKGFTGPDVVQALQGHILASTRLVTSFTRNPRLAK